MTTQAEQTDLMRTLDQQYSLLLSTLGTTHDKSLSWQSSQQQPSGSAQGVSYSCTKQVDEAVPLKPASHPTFRSRSHRRSSWTWDPQLQSELDDSFKAFQGKSTPPLADPQFSTLSAVHDPAKDKSSEPSSNAIAEESRTADGSTTQRLRHRWAEVKATRRAMRCSQL